MTGCCLEFEEEVEKWLTKGGKIRCAERTHRDVLIDNVFSRSLRCLHKDVASTRASH
jgi:hypothetical protein